MLSSLALILLIGFSFGVFVRKLSLPALVGMIFAGMLLGPSFLNLLSDSLLEISQELRSIALIIILLRAGLGLRSSVINHVGKTALALSIIPCLLEGVTLMLAATWLLGFSLIEGGILGFIVAAVSPAVVVPAMLRLQETGYGRDKGIPTLVLAGATIDDVLAITLFSAFVSLSSGGRALLAQLLRLPMNIMAGVLAGLLMGYGLLVIYNSSLLKLRNTEKLVLLISSAILLHTTGEALGIASLIGVMAIGFVLLERREATAQRFAAKLNRVWVFAEILLFTLVGAAIDPAVSLEAGFLGLILIGIGLLARTSGVLIATVGSQLNFKERLFCAIAYSPKATVQAAVGGIPLALGLAQGPVILAISVLAIITTAPLGAFGIAKGAPFLLEKANESEE